MPSLKLTKSAVDSARPGTTDYELRDTIVPGFFCKITPAGRKVFMLSYRTPNGERRKPSLGTYGQITVDQARKLAQDFLAGVRGGADPSQERQAARTAPTVKDLADRFHGRALGSAEQAVHRAREPDDAEGPRPPCDWQDQGRRREALGRR